MRKSVIGILIAIGLLLAIAIPAAAITYGTPDTTHPYVGLVGFFDEGGNWLWRCSGTLITETVFLTAGHCSSPDGADVPAFARVWFTEPGEGVGLDPIMQDYPDLECYEADPDGRAWTGYPCVSDYYGPPVANPDYRGLYLPDTHDVGLVLLDTPVNDRGFGALPPKGLLDVLATRRGLQNVTFDSVGYGLNSIKPVYSSLRTRYIATSHLVNLRSALTDGYNLQTSNNPGKWPQNDEAYSGGTCFGDSGGPLFYKTGGVEYVVGITSFGLNNNCKGADFAFRTDTDSARDFLGDYISLP
jgi:hypothetical protein